MEKSKIGKEVKLKQKKNEKRKFQNISTVLRSVRSILNNHTFRSPG